MLPQILGSRRNGTGRKKKLQANISELPVAVPAVFFAFGHFADALPVAPAVLFASGLVAGALTQLERARSESFDGNKPTNSDRSKLCLPSLQPFFVELS